MLGGPDPPTRPSFQKLSEIDHDVIFSRRNIYPATIRYAGLESGHPVLNEQRHETEIDMGFADDFSLQAVVFDI